MSEKVPVPKEAFLGSVRDISDHMTRLLELTGALENALECNDREKVDILVEQIRAHSRDLTTKKVKPWSSIMYGSGLYELGE